MSELSEVKTKWEPGAGDRCSFEHFTLKQAKGMGVVRSVRGGIFGVVRDSDPYTEYGCTRRQIRRLVTKKRREYVGTWIKTGPNELGFFTTGTPDVSLDGKAAKLREVREGRAGK